MCHVGEVVGVGGVGRRRCGRRTEKGQRQRGRRRGRWRWQHWRGRRMEEEGGGTEGGRRRKEVVALAGEEEGGGAASPIGEDEGGGAGWAEGGGRWRVGRRREAMLGRKRELREEWMGGGQR